MQQLCRGVVLDIANAACDIALSRAPKTAADVAMDVLRRVEVRTATTHVCGENTLRLL